MRLQLSSSSKWAFSKIKIQICFVKSLKPACDLLIYDWPNDCFCFLAFL